MLITTAHIGLIGTYIFGHSISDQKQGFEIQPKRTLVISFHNESHNLPKYSWQLVPKHLKHDQWVPQNYKSFNICKLHKL